MLEKPVGARPPMNAADVNQPRGEPHPLVVVEPARVVQSADEGVDAGHPGPGFADVVGDHVEPRPSRARRRSFKVFVDAIADREIHLSPVVAPAEFGNELHRLRGIGHAGHRRVANLRERKHAVTDPRRKSGDGAGNVVAGLTVGKRVDRLEALHRGDPPAGMRAIGHHAAARPTGHLWKQLAKFADQVVPRT